MATCKAKNASGKPCKMKPLKGSAYCFNHAPSKAAERAQARKRGGEARHTPHAGNPESIPAKITTIDEAGAILDYTLAELLVMDNGIARARALIALFDSYTRRFELGDTIENLLRRVAALEAMKQ